MLVDRIKSDNILQEADEFLKENVGIFSMPIDISLIDRLHKESPNLISQQASKFRYLLNEYGKYIVNTSSDIKLLPEISEMIRVFDLGLKGNFNHIDLKEFFIGSMDLQSKVQLSKRVSFKIEEALGFKVKISDASLANRESKYTLRDDIPIKINHTEKTHDVLHLTGSIIGDPKKAQNLKSNNSLNKWAYLNLPLGASMDNGHRLGRIWDGFEIAAQILYIRKKLGKTCNKDMSLSLVSNTNHAPGFTADKLGIDRSGIITRCRSFIKDMLVGDLSVYNGEF